jgi:hypothetical protein
MKYIWTTTPTRIHMRLEIYIQNAGHYRFWTPELQCLDNDYIRNSTIWRMWRKQVAATKIARAWRKVVDKRLLRLMFREWVHQTLKPNSLVFTRAKRRFHEI